MRKREIAWRLFARELRDVRHTLKGDDREPFYALTPLGARVNRIYAVGVLTDVREISDGFYKAIVSDPTGNFYITAGQYQPQGRNFLQRLDPDALYDNPMLVAFSGKVRGYMGGDPPRLYLSISPEFIVKVDEGVRSYWVLDTVRKTAMRIEAMEAALSFEKPTRKDLMDLGYPAYIADGVVEAVKEYGYVNLESYRDMLMEVLRKFRELPMAEVVQEEMPPVTEVGDYEDEMEAKVLEMIEEMDYEGTGANYLDLLDAARKEGIGQTRLDEILEALKDRGEIYEPTIMKYKRIA